MATKRFRYKTVLYKMCQLLDDLDTERFGPKAIVIHNGISWFGYKPILDISGTDIRRIGSPMIGSDKREFRICRIGYKF